MMHADTRPIPFRPATLLPGRMLPGLLLPALPFLGACADTPASAGADGPPAVTVRDSAGVTIVENGDPAELPLLELADEPSLSIGSLESDGPDQLYDVAAAFVRDDGVIVILNRGTSEVRAFGPAGTSRWSAGGPGEGPGEFSFPMSMRPMAGDSIAVWDGGSRRLTVLGARGGMARVVHLEGAGSNPLLVEPTGDGFLMVNLELDVQSDRFVPQRSTFVRHDADGAVRDTLPSAPLGEWALLEVDENSSVMRGRLFDWQASMALDSTGYWIGTGDTPSLTRYRHDGTVKAAARWPAPGRPVTDADVQAMVEHDLAGVDEDRRPVLRRFLGELEREETMPVHDNAVPTGDGGALVRLYTGPRDPAPAPWLHLDPDGRLRARLALPESFRPFQLGDGWILGVETDELDVERVRRYDLVPADPG